MSTVTLPPPGTDPTAVARRLARSDRLARRRFELLPLTGPGAAFTDVQGRLPGHATAPEGLAELISSIATVGVLQPVLVEELPDGRRPGELAAALLYERCAVLAAKLLAAGVSIPGDVTALEDPVARFRALDRLRLRTGHSRLGAPWGEVLRRLGIQFNERKAQQLVRAFTALPQDLSAEMDAAKVALHTRLRYLQLDQGNRAAARQIWDAVRVRGQPQLLSAAVHVHLEEPSLDPEKAVASAEALHDAANKARSKQFPQQEPASAGSATDATAETHARDTVAEAIYLLRRVIVVLRGGVALPERDVGSLRLSLEEALRCATENGH